MSTPERRSRLVVLAGPTAVGKGTVAAAVREAHPEVWISVSATTRPPRPGEENGVHYWFVSDAEFDRMIAEDDLLEWAVVHKAARYGTPRQPVELALASGQPAMLEIDLQGARQVRRTMPDALFVFLSPPSWEELVRRLVGRGTETRGRARAPAGDRARRAGGRVGVRHHHRQPRSSRGSRAVGSLAEATTDRSVRRFSVPGPIIDAQGVTNPPIDDLLTKTDSKYKLVLYSAKRARQINAYYSQLGEGLLEYVGPLVDTHVQEKPLSIALREISEDLLTCEDVDPAELAAEAAAQAAAADAGFNAEA